MVVDEDILGCCTATILIQVKLDALDRCLYNIGTSLQFLTSMHFGINEALKFLPHIE